MPLTTPGSVSVGSEITDPHHEELTSRNVLSLTRAITPEEADQLRDMRERVLAIRDDRVPPGLDDKVLTSWNGLALAAFAEAGRVLDEPRYRAVAERNAAFVREELWHDSRLQHTYKAGVAKADGLLEDYSYYGLGLIELYRTTGDLAHLEWAAELLDAVLTRFADDAGPQGDVASAVVGVDAGVHRVAEHGLVDHVFAPGEPRRLDGAASRERAQLDRADVLKRATGADEGSPRPRQEHDLLAGRFEQTRGARRNGLRNGENLRLRSHGPSSWLSS